ncbi:MAG: glutathione S-transferase family protein [Alphaproteobacteria bacterium]|nr:glutathione S-transferase family protein [Alphaproteobacteria bacterium]OJV15994.1 MAG: hypothetical protein BGO27_04010 [Alphaproteobacteria bacterium 33-17]
MNTNILYYHSVCPKSRFVRILMQELDFEAEIKIEEYWKFRDNFLKINPAGDLPILVTKNEKTNKPQIITGIFAIFEYVIHHRQNNFLIDQNQYNMAEVRRLIEWCTVKMYNEVTMPLINEKIICYYRKDNSPNSQIIRNAKHNLNFHLEYLSMLLSENDWVAGNKISAADLFFASHISTLDYLGEISWPNYQTLKHWYMLIKSRPSFRNILNEKITGFAPSNSYELLDF